MKPIASRPKKLSPDRLWQESAREKTADIANPGRVLDQVSRTDYAMRIMILFIHTICLPADGISK
jgi:hypothetical protein